MAELSLKVRLGSGDDDGPVSQARAAAFIRPWLEAAQAEEGAPDGECWRISLEPGVLINALRVLAGRCRAMGLRASGEIE